MGRGNSEQKRAKAANKRGARPAVPAEEQLLRNHDWFLKTLEFRSRDQLGNLNGKSIEQIDEARSRSFRPLMERTDQQRMLCKALQDSFDLQRFAEAAGELYPRLEQAAAETNPVPMAEVEQIWQDLLASDRLTQRWHLRETDPRLGSDGVLDGALNQLESVGLIARQRKGIKLLKIDASAALASLQETASRAHDVVNRSGEIMWHIHDGFIRQQVMRQTQMFDGENPEDVRQVLRQEARMGVIRGMDKLDFDVKAKPLTYLKTWIRASISEATQREARLVRLKSKAHDYGKAVQEAVKIIRSEGRQVTIAEVADRTKLDIDKVAEVLPFVSETTVRLDAPVNYAGEGDQTIGGLTPDDRQDIESAILGEDERQAVRAAVASLPSPYIRRVVELCYGLHGGDPVEQKALFDGVYRDRANGKCYSAEPSVLTARKKAGEQIERASQTWLNDQFKKGNLEFVPGTPEAFELSLRQGDKWDPDARFGTAIQAGSGVPPTSGTVQEAKRKAEELMSKHPALQALRRRYRGENELENSQQARDEIRYALSAKGIVNLAEADRLKANKGDIKKGPLRLLAEKHGLVDPETGVRNHAALAEIIGEDWASPEASWRINLAKARQKSGSRAAL